MHRPRDINVRAIREQLGLSQSELANVLQVSKRTLQNWEQGRRGPTGAAQTLLRVMQREPNAVRRALRA
jgi:putative transcriptional regulator